MPRQSEKNLALQDLRIRVQQRLLFREYRDRIGEHDEDEDHIDELVFFTFQRVKNARYLERGPYRKEDTCIFSRDLQAVSPDGSRPWMNDSDFQEKYRMSRAAFHEICNLVRGHHVFSEKRISGRKQAPVEHQLMVLLFYLVVEGNGPWNCTRVSGAGDKGIVEPS